ncbi:BEN domain-containing protein 7 isoform X2 [Denticeps clupeoides]|uniref:BEN domain-containing protein n=1 Tax=Denticeps clupeoides TaxID=299321 RepID=A0AAY4B1C0_9TELE|nr:BEN domain-containing protein 7 isoform X2 [Denticeps clupeoides]
MESAERKRSRKSQSFKLVSGREFEPEYYEDADVHSDQKDVAEAEAWLGDDGMEIKRQITGMMRLLSDKSGRVYHRVPREGDGLREEPRDEAFGLDPDEPQHSAWTSGPLSSAQYGTRSRTQRMIGQTKDAVRPNDVAVPPPPVATATERSCCMCNCKSTLQAILLELRTMRKFMQAQKAPHEKPGAPGAAWSSRSPAPKKRARKRRPVHRVAPLATPIRTALPTSLRPEPPAPSSPPRPNPPPTSVAPPTSHFSPIRGQNSAEPEVQLAEDYDVFIPKSQLDSILVNYTRSGSLLFRKLVCAFFDDTTLANSLPNGKRKRGLNDHRKGLDQNIVGAIKVFTEKYCTANRIEKLPGARDWVQILQDQIKLARRRLKRAENSTDCDEAPSGPTQNTGPPQHSSGQRDDGSGLTG